MNADAAKMPLNSFTVIVCLASFVLLGLAGCGTLEVGIERTAPAEGAAAATPANSATTEPHLATSIATQGNAAGDATAARPTPTSVLDRGRLSYDDPLLGLSIDMPLWWQPQAAPGVAIRFFEGGNAGVNKAVLVMSVLNPESNSLESALIEVTQGAWGPHIVDAGPVALGAFQALRLELNPGADRPRVAWLVVAPSGRALIIHTDVDPALIEQVIEVVLATLRPLDSIALGAASDLDQTLAPMPTLSLAPSPTVAPALAPFPTRDSMPTGVELPASLYLLPGEYARSERPRSVWSLVPGGATVERITPPRFGCYRL